jgi:hypothetical protein
LEGLGYQGHLSGGGDMPGTDDDAHRVVRQEPPPGARVNRDGAITLYYGA